MAPQYFTVGELAKQLKVKQQSVLKWIRIGELRGIDVSSKPGVGRPRWRIPHDALLEFENNRLGVQEPKPRRLRKSKPSYTKYF